MFDFLNIEPESFGLDISDLSLKIVKLKKRGKFLTLASWGEIKIKPGIIKGGEIKEKNPLIEAIRKERNKLKGEKIRTKNVIVSLPENKAFFQVIQMPKMERRELKAAVPFEAENYIPLSVEDVYLDFEIVPGFYENLDFLNILVVAVPKKIVNSYLSCLIESGLSVQALEVESQAIVRALIKNKVNSFSFFNSAKGKKPEIYPVQTRSVLIIDFGKSMTSLIFFADHSIRFTCSLPISSFDITEAIAENLRVDLAEAEKLKLKYGLKIEKGRQLKNGENEKIFKAVKSVLADLTEQTGKYINYYQTHIGSAKPLLKEKNIEKIILCGRGTNLKGLTEFFSSRLKIPVELGNPWINILPNPLKEVPEMSYEESLGYTTALGLALRGMMGDK